MAEQGALQVNHSDDGTLRVHLSGSWTIKDDLPSAADLLSQGGIASQTRRIEFDG